MCRYVIVNSVARRNAGEFVAISPGPTFFSISLSLSFIPSTFVFCFLFIFLLTSYCSSFSEAAFERREKSSLEENRDNDFPFLKTVDPIKETRTEASRTRAAMTENKREREKERGETRTEKENDRARETNAERVERKRESTLVSVFLFFFLLVTQ